MRPCGQAETGAQISLAAVPSAGVGFVIVAGEVEQAVEDEDLELC